MTQPPWLRKTGNPLALVLQYLPLLVIVIAAAIAHVRTEVRVEANAGQIARVEESQREWLVRIEEKLDRVIERELTR